MQLICENVQFMIIIIFHLKSNEKAHVWERRKEKERSCQKSYCLHDTW